MRIDNDVLTNSRNGSDLIQLLNPDGKSDPSILEDIPREKIHNMYELMVLTRIWNDKAISLQRQGRLGTYPSVKGQEATNAGMAMVLEKEDWFVPAFREFGTMFHLGVPLAEQFMFWGGDERGGRIPEDLRMTNVSIIVGGHLPHAVGIAYASKLKKEKNMTLVCMGDGATSEGDFHESLNLASLLKVPVVFVIQNNGWAISTPVNKQTSTRTLAEKACAYDMDNALVDGNDALAVYKTLDVFAKRARDEQKPALIELVTYRMDDHTTADDATRYRPTDELEAWRKKDPIDRLQKFIRNHLDWDDSKNEKLMASCVEKVEQAVKEYENMDKPQPRDMFKFMYTEMPWHLKEQQDQVIRLHEKERE